MTGRRNKKAPLSGRFSCLAAGVVGVAATAAVVTAAAAQPVVAATAAEQDQQDDDPAHIATTRTIVTHRRYLQEVLRLSPLIPRYSPGGKMCGGGFSYLLQYLSHRFAVPPP